ncbi:MAG: hypothetical protein KJ941_02255 [Bacteroidetes bacterium]|nr:hypothetical protein [Bacteroidota bacterium]
MKTNTFLRIDSKQSSDLFLDCDGVLNSNRITPCSTLTHIDDFYFKVKEISKGMKVKNLIAGKQLLNLDIDAFFYFTKEFHRLYSKMAIVSSNPITIWRVKFRLKKLDVRVPIGYFTSTKMAKKWLTSDASQN